jgi:hypothetical protein
MALIEVDLDFIDTGDLIEELENRGYRAVDKDDYWTVDNEGDLMVLTEIYRLIRTEGDYKPLIEEFVLSKLGKVI